MVDDNDELNRNRMRLEWRNPRTLQPNEKNWKQHPPTQREAFSLFFDEVDWAGALLFNERTGRLLDGHMRQQEALERNLDAVPTLIIDVPEEVENKILANVDPIGTLFNEDVKARQLLLDSIGDNAVVSLLDKSEDGGATALLKRVQRLPEGGISLVPGERYNYVMLIFNSEIDWVAAQDHFELKRVKCAFTSAVGMGVVVDGSKYLAKVYQDEWDSMRERLLDEGDNAET